MSFLDMKKIVGWSKVLDYQSYVFDVIYHNWIVSSIYSLSSSAISKDVGFVEGQLYLDFF